MKTTTITIMIMLAVLASCSGDDDVSDVKPPIADVLLPQGGDAEADREIQSLFKTYDTYFIYDFTAKDLNWTMVTGGLFETQYRHTPIEPSSVCNLIAAISDTWLRFYPEPFLKRYLPKYIYLAEKLEAGEEVYSYAEEQFVTKWTPIKARYAGNQVAIANVDGVWQQMDKQSRWAFKCNVEAVALNYFVSKGAIAVPEEFYDVSSYEGSYLSESKARREGFIVNPATGKDWATTALQLTREQDIEAYLAGMAFYTSADWRSVYNGNTNVRKKYDILLQALKDAGVDVSGISTFN